jgi:hypothetical protein
VLRKVAEIGWIRDLETGIIHEFRDDIYISLKPLFLIQTLWSTHPSVIPDLVYYPTITVFRRILNIESSMTILDFTLYVAFRKEYSVIPKFQLVRFYNPVRCRKATNRASQLTCGGRGTIRKSPSASNPNRDDGRWSGQNSK